MATYQLYIGSDNKVGQVDKIKLATCLKGLDGYTIIDSLGYWQGTSENSVIVIIAGITLEDINIIIDNVKLSMQQMAVGVQLVNEIEFK